MSSSKVTFWQKSLKNSDEILAKALTRIDFVSIAFFILVDFYAFLKVLKLKTGGVEMLRSSLRENLLMSWQEKFLVKMSIFCLLHSWRSRDPFQLTLMKLSCTFARMIPLTDMVNSMVQVIRVQNPYRHSTRENEWQNCGKKFDFKSLKWRIISLVQPFLSVFFFFAISSFRILQKIITKWSYRYFLWLLICRQKKLNNYCKMGNYNVQKTACQSSKKSGKKILSDRENVNCNSQCDWKSRKKCLTSRCLKITEKSLIQHCERSELRLQFEWTKVH